MKIHELRDRVREHLEDVPFETSSLRRGSSSETVPTLFTKEEFDQAGGMRPGRSFHDSKVLRGFEPVALVEERAPRSFHRAWADRLQQEVNRNVSTYLAQLMDEKLSDQADRQAAAFYRDALPPFGSTRLPGFEEAVIVDDQGVRRAWEPESPMMARHLDRLGW